MTAALFDTFGLANMSPQTVARGTFRALDRLQDYKPHEQAAAAACLLLIICETCGVEPQTVFVPVKNLLLDEREGGREQFKAVRMYAANELAKR
jgi:hypothetical protein